MENRIEIILSQKGLTKTEFAAKMGTSKQNVNSLLKNPTQAKLAEIAIALDVPLWQLFASPADVAPPKSELQATCPHCGKPLAIEVNVK